LFIEELIRVIKSVNTSDILNIETLEIGFLNLVSSILLTLWREHGKSIQRLSILPSIPRVSGTTIVNITLIFTGQPSILKTGSSSREWSRMPNIPSLT